MAIHKIICKQSLNESLFRNFELRFNANRIELLKKSNYEMSWDLIEATFGQRLGLRALQEDN